jgi:hypothetical protein
LTYRHNHDQVTVSVSPAEGTYQGQVEQRAYVVELAATGRPRIVTLNGKRADADYEEKSRMLRVKVPFQSIHKAVTVSARY